MTMPTKTLKGVVLSEVCDAIAEPDGSNFRAFLTDFVAWGDAAYTLVAPEKVIAGVRANAGDFKDHAAVVTALQKLMYDNRYLILEG